MKRFVLMLASVALSAGLHAQVLPSVNHPAEVKEGTFPNGLHYFIVSNPAEAGFADYAIVQPGMDGRVDPLAFLESRGVGYGPKGVNYTLAGARIISYSDVPAREQSERDSTLLMLLDYVWQSPFNQTIIISGDVDIVKTERALEVMNLTVPTLLPRDFDIPGSQSFFETFSEPAGDVVRIGARYGVSLPEPELRSTPVPFVTELLVKQFSAILSERVGREFRNAAIPISLLDTGFSSTVGDSGYDLGTMGFYVCSEREAEAAELFRAIIGGIGEHGVTSSELDNSRRITVPSVVMNALRKGEPNAKYIERCIAASIFGLHINSAKDIRSFFQGRNMDSRKAHLLFNRFACSLVSGCSAGNIEPVVDTLTRMPEQAVVLDGKLKLKSETADPVSGGSVWTFDNGMKVVYKKMEDIKGRFSYAFSLRGGLSVVPGIAKGEAPYVADMLDLSLVDGTTPLSELKAGLSRKGITMRQEVTMSDFRITGSAPSSCLEDILVTIRTIATRRVPDPEQYDYYMECEKVRTKCFLDARLNMRETLDALACPDNRYLRKRDVSAVGPDLQQRAEKFFRDRFSNFADGEVVLVGDLDEAQVKEILERNLQMFSTSRKYSYRKADSFLLQPGSIKVCAKGEPSVQMSWVIAEPVTTAGVARLKVLSKLLVSRLNLALRGLGAYVSVSSEYEIYPEELMKLYVSARPLPGDCLPEGVRTIGPETLAGLLGDALGSMDAIDARRLSDAKVSVLGERAVENTRAARITDKILLRYSEGKDFSQDFEASVQAVGEKDLLELLGRFCEGVRVEYVTNK